MKISRLGIMTTMLVSVTAQAAGLPDFSKWATKVLRDDGISDARIIETQYPFSFTYCHKDSQTLWRYNVMSPEQLEAIREGRVVKPVSTGEKSTVVENGSPACLTEG